MSNKHITLYLLNLMQKFSIDAWMVMSYFYTISEILDEIHMYHWFNCFSDKKIVKKRRLFDCWFLKFGINGKTKKSGKEAGLFMSFFFFSKKKKKPEAFRERKHLYVCDVWHVSLTWQWQLRNAYRLRAHWDPPPPPLRFYVTYTTEKDILSAFRKWMLLFMPAKQLGFTAC